MSQRFVRPRALAAALALAVAPAVCVVAAPAAQAATTTCSGSGTISAGDYMIQANEWNSSAQQCITYNGGTSWTVSTANFDLSGGAPATYPSIYKGCHWGLCTGDSGFPIQMRRLASATTSWSTDQPGSGTYDVSYDIWFKSTPTTSGQPDGTEVMIWINSRGGVQPFGSQTGNVNLDGMNWNVWTGRQTSWNIISYVLNHNGTKVIVWSCNGQSNQRWNLNSNGTITGVQSGLCLDVTGAGTADGTPVELWSCNGGSNQQWSLG